jgi:excisionase family DNA binding protein
MGTATGEGPVTGTLMTVAEVAGVLRVSTMTVYRLIQAGELPAIRIGKSFRIQRHDLQAYLADGIVRAEQSNG